MSRNRNAHRCCQKFVTAHRLARDISEELCLTENIGHFEASVHWERFNGWICIVAP